MAATAALAAGACLGALPGAGAPASAAASDQAVAYQVDAVHSGAQPGDALTAPLLQGWSVDLGGPVSYPLVAGGRVFVTVGSTASGQHSRLVALDEASGATLWTTSDLGGTYTFSASAYDGGRVFTVNDSGLLDGFDAATGAMTWSVKLPVQYMFTSPPTALNGTIYVGGAGAGGTVYAVSETNGALLWSQPVMNGDDSSPAATASGVYVTYACQQDYAFNPADGTPLWHHATGCEGGGGATPVVAGGRVYDLNSGLVNGTWTSPVILDASTGAEVGGFTADRTPAFDGSTAFLMSQNTLRSVAMPGGTVNWSFAGDGTLASAPVVANGTVYVGGSSGMLYGLDEASGAVVWSQHLNGSLAATTGCVCQVTGLAVAESHLVAPAGTTLSAFVTAPVVTGVSPQTGSTLGGATVTVSGRGFTGTTAVTFGTRPATSFSVTSDGSITATSPPEAAGPVDVRVTVPAGTSAVSAADRFLYVAPPTVTRVCPNQGPTRGGTQVTITGTGLGGATAVSFGGVAAGYTVTSATQISAVTPPHVAATVDVTVTTALGTSAASSADRFVYAKKPRPTC